jgi:hypothetical protein
LILAEKVAYRKQKKVMPSLRIMRYDHVVGL